MYVGDKAIQIEPELLTILCKVKPEDVMVNCVGGILCCRHQPLHYPTVCINLFVAWQP